LTTRCEKNVETITRKLKQTKLIFGFALRASYETFMSASQSSSALKRFVDVLKRDEARRADREEEEEEEEEEEGLRWIITGSNNNEKLPNRL
jgi:hypothetical protein